jgi:hypothetical protein
MNQERYRILVCRQRCGWWTKRYSRYEEPQHGRCGHGYEEIEVAPICEKCQDCGSYDPGWVSDDLLWDIHLCPNLDFHLPEK